MLQYAVPPGYQRQQPIKRPKLGPWLGVINAILEDDKQRPGKQRHTAKRIFERLREEHSFTGGYTIVKDYVRSAELHSREMFIPLTHAPGEAQADFGEALVVIAGVEQKAHYLAMDLPHSDDCFVIAFPAETTEAFLEGHVRAFAYFSAVPTRILYDNTKIAVARILGGEERQRTRAFSELQSHYLFADKFGRPAKGNDKGKVEGLVGYARRNFMVPIPRVSSWEELNTRLEAESQKRRLRRLRGHTEAIGERFKRYHAAMLPLPAAPYEACEKIAGRVSSLSLVRYRSNDYSVPTQYGHRQVWVKGYVHEVVIACASAIIARHERSYERETVVFDPLHYQCGQAWATLVSFLSLPAEPAWAEYVLGVVEAKERIKALDGIGCQPVLISATTEEALDWIGEGLRSQTLSFPEKNGPITWPQYSLPTSLNPLPAVLASAY
jgi:transposase